MDLAYGRTPIIMKSESQAIFMYQAAQVCLKQLYVHHLDSTAVDIWPYMFYLSTFIHLSIHPLSTYLFMYHLDLDNHLSFFFWLKHLKEVVDKDFSSLIYLKIRKSSYITKCHFALKNIRNNSALWSTGQSSLTFSTCPQNVFCSFPPTKSQSGFMLHLIVILLLSLNLNLLSHIGLYWLLEMLRLRLVECPTFQCFLIVPFWYNLLFFSIPCIFHQLVGINYGISQSDQVGA